MDELFSAFEGTYIIVVMVLDMDSWEWTDSTILKDKEGREIEFSSMNEAMLMAQKLMNDYRGIYPIKFSIRDVEEGPESEEWLQ